MSDVRFVYVTTGDEAEAGRIAEAVVGERLAACANIIPGMRSVYRWQGKVERGQETVLILKTTAGRSTQLAARIKALHSYDVPCVVALEVEGGNPDFLAWVAAETSP
jgi:periplasmic divalent cation tolerance protein